MVVNGERFVLALRCSLLIPVACTYRPGVSLTSAVVVTVEDVQMSITLPALMVVGEMVPTAATDCVHILQF